MPARHFPVRPNLEQLRNQAKDLLRDVRARVPEALADLREYHPEKTDPASAKLADVQLVLARRNGLPSWTRIDLKLRIKKEIREEDM
jgi:hypothetical protein